MHGVYIFHIVSPLKQTIHKIIEEIEDNVRSKETEDNMRYSDGANTPILDSMILLLMQCRILAIGLELLIIVCYWFFFLCFIVPESIPFFADAQSSPKHMGWKGRT